MWTTVTRGTITVAIIASASCMLVISILSVISTETVNMIPPIKLLKFYTIRLMPDSSQIVLLAKFTMNEIRSI